MSGNGMKAKSAARKWKRMKMSGVRFTKAPSVLKPLNYLLSLSICLIGGDIVRLVLWLKCYFELFLTKHLFSWFYGHGWNSPSTQVEKTILRSVRGWVRQPYPTPDDQPPFNESCRVYHT